MLSERKVLDRGMAAILSLILVLSLYLLERALDDLAREGLRMLESPPRIPVSVRGVRFFYVIMTLAWPSLLGLLCLLGEAFVARKITLHDLLATELKRAGGHGAFPALDSSFDQELRGSRERFALAALAVVPAVAVSLHALGGVVNLVLLRRLERLPLDSWPAPPGDLWPVHWAVASAWALTLSGALTLWSAMRLLHAFRRLGTAVSARSPSPR